MGTSNELAALVATIAETAKAHGQGRIVTFASYAAAVLHNGLGRHDRALESARRVFKGDVLGYQTLAVSELAEAASRTGDHAVLEEARAWMSARVRATPTAWARGIDARVRALASDGAAAEANYRESIECLKSTRLRVELARGHLLYGEWLRREGRRGEARDELRPAHHMLEEMGVAAFAERARRELLATGERIRKRTTASIGSLTAQEAQIAGLVKEGLTNPEIGTRLFLSAAHRRVALGQRVRQGRSRFPATASRRRSRRPHRGTVVGAEMPGPACTGGFPWGERPGRPRMLAA